MDPYRLIAVALHFLVNILLLWAVGAAAQSRFSVLRCLLASVLGGAYAAVCSLPGLSGLGGGVFYTAVLLLTGAIAFGIGREAIRKCALFCLLRIAVDGIPTQDGTIHFLRSGLLCIAGFILLRAQSRYVPVELTVGGRVFRLTALRDTGNTLRDPISGKPVLVIGGELAQEMTGFSREQLANPVETVVKQTDLRLIPCRSATAPTHFLLARSVPGVRIGRWKGRAIVAFAPENIGQDEHFQALTGGMV